MKTTLARQTFLKRVRIGVLDFLTRGLYGLPRARSGEVIQIITPQPAALDLGILQPLSVRRTYAAYHPSLQQEPNENGIIRHTFKNDHHMHASL